MASMVWGDTDKDAMRHSAHCQALVAQLEAALDEPAGSGQTVVALEQRLVAECPGWSRLRRSLPEGGDAERPAIYQR